MLRFSQELDINLPRQRVAELFSDHNNAIHWQSSLLRIKHVSGTPREQGAVHVLIHKMGKREFEMTETLEEVDPPQRYVATYEAEKIWNRFCCEFTETNEGTTHWCMDSEFQCGGVMRVMQIFAPGIFKKQAVQSMRDFKSWAESV